VPLDGGPATAGLAEWEVLNDWGPTATALAGVDLHIGRGGPVAALTLASWELAHALLLSI
jgi:hypothetical protein